jgi:hypothetical protein
MCPYTINLLSKNNAHSKIILQHNFAGAMMRSWLSLELSAARMHQPSGYMHGWRHTATYQPSAPKTHVSCQSRGALKLPDMLTTVTHYALATCSARINQSIT